MKILEFLEILDCLESLETLENQETSEKEKRLLRLRLRLTLTLNFTDLYKKRGACSYPRLKTLTFHVCAQFMILGPERSLTLYYF